MKVTHYVALLRGINVGGANMIRMSDLKTCIEGCKVGNVATYIASGNVLFEAAGPGADPAKLAKKLEDTLSKTFSPYRGRIVLCSHADLEAIVRKAPKGFGKEPERYRYDVIFLRPPLTAAQAIRAVRTKEGVDQASTGPGVLYFSRLIARAAESQLSRTVGSPIYDALTVRNWNTTTKLLALMDTRARG